MNAQALRTIIISRDDLVDVQAALDNLSNGKALSAIESGVIAYAAMTAVKLAAQPTVTFDGFKWTVFLFVTTG